MFIISRNVLTDEQIYKQITISIIFILYIYIFYLSWLSEAEKA